MLFNIFYLKKLQGGSAYEAGQIMEKLVGEGYGGISQLQTPWPLWSWFYFHTHTHTAVICSQSATFI